MKQFSYYFLIALLVVSCNKRTVQLPETRNQLITEISDVSAAYIFYNEDTQEAEFNRNNIIGTTNWLVNVDKRLNLKNAMPHLIYLQEKRQKDGMHKNDEARNYFTCSNPDIENLAFIEFTQINYQTKSINEFLKNNPESNGNYSQVFLNFKSDGMIDIGKNFILKSTDSTNFMVDLGLILANDDLQDKVYLNIDEELTFQDYITYKSMLLKIDVDKALISNDEFIYK